MILFLVTNEIVPSLSNCLTEGKQTRESLSVL
jgi:hypothetical protein